MFTTVKRDLAARTVWSVLDKVRQEDIHRQEKILLFFSVTAGCASVKCCFVSVGFRLAFSLEGFRLSFIYLITYVCKYLCIYKKRERQAGQSQPFVFFPAGIYRAGYT